jgi:uncharacterized glyoxalase superfamily protein PhnB
MSKPELAGAVPYVFCADAGTTADWCLQTFGVLGVAERGRWSRDDGTITNVDLMVGSSEIWLDGPVPDWSDHLGGLPSWVGLIVDDLDAAHRLLTDAGIPAAAPTDRGNGFREISLTDPEGHLWGLIEHGGRNEPGQPGAGGQ